MDIVFEQKFQMPGLTQGLNNSMDSSIARPFRVLVENGKNVGKVNNIFYNRKGDSKKYVLGSLCNTSYAKEKSRLLFFPGIIGRKFLFHSEGGDIGNDLIVDHFTIEPNFKTWHYTVRKANGDKERFSDNKVFEIEKDLFYWFGLSMSNAEVLEPLYEKYLLGFTVSSNKLKDINAKMMSAKQNAILHTIEQPETEPNIQNEFIHFDFLVDKRKVRTYNALSKLSLAPTSKPILAKDIPLTSNSFQTRYFEIKLDDFAGYITVIVSKHKGTLSQEIMVSALDEKFELA